MTEEQKFRDWLRRNYGVQDYEAYRNTQTEELAIQYAKHVTAQLQQHGVSGKRPFECPNCHATLQEVEMTNREILDALAACASGAVDTVVERGIDKWCDSCGKVTRWVNGECINYTERKRKSSEGQP